MRSLAGVFVLAACGGVQNAAQPKPPAAPVSSAPAPLSLEVNSAGTGLVMRRAKWQHPVHDTNVGLAVSYNWGAGVRDARVRDESIDWLIEFADRPKPGMTGVITYRYLFKLSKADRTARDERAEQAADAASTFIDTHRDRAVLAARSPELLEHFAPLRVYTDASGVTGDEVVLRALGFEPAVEDKVWMPTERTTRLLHGWAGVRLSLRISRKYANDLAANLRKVKSECAAAITKQHRDDAPPSDDGLTALINVCAPGIGPNVQAALKETDDDKFLQAVNQLRAKAADDNARYIVSLLP